MKDSVDALLVFCEGPHDSAFIRMVTSKLMNYKRERLKFSEMPSPFNSLFATAVEKHAARDMSLDMTHKFFLPDTVLRKDKKMIFIYNCGGKTQYAKVRELLSDYLPLIKEASTFPGEATEVATSVKYLFVYDSDTDGVDTIQKKINEEYSKIGDENFIKADWKKTNSQFGRVSDDKAFYLWCSNSEKGTLEDILFPILQANDHYKSTIQSSKEMMLNTFDWELDDGDEIHSTAENEKLKKAIITASGQRKKPGASFTVILEQSGFFSRDGLKQCATTALFTEFVDNFFQ